MNEGRTSLTIVLEYVVRHRKDEVGTVYLSIVKCTNGMGTCTRTIGVQCGARSTAVLVAVLCAVVIVSTVVLTTSDICTVW